MICIAHLSDLHFCARHLTWVSKAMDHAIDHAIEHGAQCAVISGDALDAAINLHEPAVSALFARVRRLANRMPVLILQGTPSHDRPGSLAPLRALGPRVLVVERICQAALVNGEAWQVSEGHAFDAAPEGDTLFSCLPSVNKAAVAAVAGVDRAAEQAGDAVLALCQAWAALNEHARAAGVPTVLVSHGTVNGCVTETARAMVSPDHEFTTGALFAAEASACMLGHIHAHQSWADGRRRIAYPGSLTKLIYGHQGQTGYLLWNVDAGGAEFDPVPCPSREMIEAEFAGPPSMQDMEEIARSATGAYVRLRYSVDEEHRHAVDRAAILALFAAAEEIKIEARVNPVQRVRAAGISQAQTTADKLRGWCSVTGTEAGPLLERLALLEEREVVEIVGSNAEPKRTPPNKN